MIFSTPGIDRYQDGSVVRDGEFYAVVCAPNAAQPDFYGFTAAGELVDPVNNVMVCRLAKAKDGHCPRVTLSVPKGTLSGRVHIVMMDTRSLVTDLPGAGHVVRGYSVAVSDEATTFVRTAGMPGAVAVASLPVTDIPQPVITGLEIRDGWAYLRVTQVVPGVYYRVRNKHRIEDQFVALADDYLQSDGGSGTVLFTVPLDAGESGFFQIGIRPLDEGDAP